MGVMAVTLTDIVCELVVSHLPPFGEVVMLEANYVHHFVVYYDHCRLNLRMVGEDHHHMIATVVIVVTVVGVVVDFLGALTIVVCLILIVLS